MAVESLSAALGLDPDSPTAPPEPWRSMHLVPAMNELQAWSALLGVCKAARVWALQEAAQQFTARVSLDRQPASIQRNVAAVLDAIATRGSKGSGVIILHRGRDDQLVVSTLQALQPVALHITALDLPYATTDILTAAATVLPHLTKLRIHTLLETMLDGAFPVLEHLHVDSVCPDNTQPILTSISHSFFRQLHSLTFNQCLSDCSGLLADLSPLLGASSNLQSLTVAGIVNPQFLDTLQGSAPNLTHLAADQISMGRAGQAPVTGSCTQLSLRKGWVLSTDLEQFPLPPGDQQLTITSPAEPLTLLVPLTTEGVSAAFCGRMERLNLQRLQQVIVTLPSYPGTTCWVSFQAALLQLAALHQPDTTMVVKVPRGHRQVLSATPTQTVYLQQLCRALEAASQAWPRLGLDLSALQESEAARVLTALPALQLHSLEMNSLSFECYHALCRSKVSCVEMSAKHGAPFGRPWDGNPPPCQRIKLQAAHSADLPLPSCSTANAEVHIAQLYADAHIARAAAHVLDRVSSRLSAQSVCVRPLPCDPLWRTRCRCREQPGAMVDMVQLLQYVQGIQRIAVEDWIMRPETVAALAGLPDQRGIELTLTFQWSSDPQLYLSLGAAIPTSYRHLRLGSLEFDSRPPAVLLVQLCLGASQPRTEDQPLHVVLARASRQECGEAQRLLSQAGVGPHITVGYLEEH